MLSLITSSAHFSTFSLSFIYFFRSVGIALASCLPPVHPELPRHPLIVPTPCSYSRRISSNSSTFRLLPNRASFSAWFRRIGYTALRASWAISEYQSGPNQSIELIRSMKEITPDSAALEYDIEAAVYLAILKSGSGFPLMAGDTFSADLTAAAK